MRSSPWLLLSCESTFPVPVRQSHREGPRGGKRLLWMGAGRGNADENVAPDESVVSPRQELVQGAAIVRKWHWGFSSTFALVSHGSGVCGCRGASCFQGRCSVTQWCELKK